MGIPLRQQIRVGVYILRQRLFGRRRYPLVLMLEPLFRCNLACGMRQDRLPDPDPQSAPERQGVPGRRRRMRGADRFDPRRRAADPQGDRRDREGPDRAPAVRLPVHQRAPGREEDRSLPAQPYLTFSIHLDGLREHHDRVVCQDGVFDRAVAAIRLLRSAGSA